jgi:hypothetical protein
MLEIRTYRKVYQIPSPLSLKLKMGSKLYSVNDESEVAIKGCIGWGSSSKSGKYKSILSWSVDDNNESINFNKDIYCLIGVDGSYWGPEFDDTLKSEIMELSRIIYRKMESISDVLDYNLNDAIHFVLDDKNFFRERVIDLFLEENHVTS